MRLHSLMIASALAMGLAVPAMAQSSTMHRYVQFFKYSDAAVKEMTENPQDRAATLAKLYESAGGKMESIYWFPTGGQYDGMVIGQFPDDVNAEAISLTVRSTGSLANSQTVAAMTAIHIFSYSRHFCRCWSVGRRWRKSRTHPRNSATP